MGNDAALEAVPAFDSMEAQVVILFISEDGIDVHPLW
jgi:hypothetical protein